MATTMKRHMLAAVATTLLFMAQSAWALSSSDVGKVLGSDGKMYKTVAAATNAGTTASGIIAYVGEAGSVEESSSTYRGLAISVSNAAESTAWCHNSCGVQTTACATLSEALSKKDGLSCTALLGSPEARNSDGHYHDAAAVAYDYNDTVARPAGSSRWFLPALGQWNLALKGLTGSTDLTEENNPDYSYYNNSTKIIAAGGTRFSWSFYRSTTEYDGTYAWFIGFNGDGGNASHQWSKGHAPNMYIRPFFAFESATDAVYTISYNAHGGSGAPSAQAKDGGIDLTLSSTAPTRAGYTFAGWNTAADGSGTSYASGATFTGNADTTLYAQWGGYGAWAEDNGITGAWNETSGGIYNVFRYVFNVPSGEFTNPPLIDIALEDGKVVIKTPPVVNSDGVTVSVVESSDVAGETVTATKAVDASGSTEFTKDSTATSRFYRLSVVEAE